MPVMCNTEALIIWQCHPQHNTTYHNPTLFCTWQRICDTPPPSPPTPTPTNAVRLLPTHTQNPEKCRGILEEQRRLWLLHQTLTAHLKLAEELSPKELQAHAHSPDPVSAALAARRAALQAVHDSYSHLVNHHLGIRAAPESMHAYYAALEGLIKEKDQDVKQFQQVVEGEEEQEES